ncbi:MAG: hypothetical protein CL816_05485 [Coxiellaceae bacterium]|nr:hypothetical protein [Coxiellaceae bacterium]
MSSRSINIRKKETEEDNESTTSNISELSSYTMNDVLSDEIEIISNTLKSLQERFIHKDARRKCLSLFNKPHHKSTAFIQCALEILDDQNNLNSAMSDYDRLQGLHRLYVKHIQIRLIEKPDRHVRSRTAEIDKALAKTALGLPGIFTPLDDTQNNISTLSRTFA